jgi:HEAT repeat protein
LWKLNETINTERRHKMKVYKGFLTAVLFAAVLTISVNAQNNSVKDVTSNKYALQNLVAGIHSENDGVRRSSIYLAGYYKITDAEDALIEQLKNEKNASTRILISLVLYELGSEKGLSEVKNLSTQDKDAKVRRITSQIYDDFVVRNAQGTAFSGE